jgi:hypothetical protein
MPKQNTKLESEGAEFLVLGQLLIAGIPTYKTYTNLPGYDLIATSPETNRSAMIQVKSRWATDANHFLIKTFNCDFVVLVRLNRGHRYTPAKLESLPEEPEYYVLTAREAKKRATDVETGWDKIRWQEKDFEPHRRKWNIIREFLQIPEKQKFAKAGQHVL